MEGADLSSSSLPTSGAVGAEGRTLALVRRPGEDAQHFAARLLNCVAHGTSVWRQRKRRLAQNVQAFASAEAERAFAAKEAALDAFAAEVKHGHWRLYQRLYYAKHKTVYLERARRQRQVAVVIPPCEDDEAQNASPPEAAATP